MKLPTWMKNNTPCAGCGKPIRWWSSMSSKIRLRTDYLEHFHSWCFSAFTLGVVRCRYGEEL
jgi:hypothetical protein